MGICLFRRAGIPIWSQGSKLRDKSASKAELEKESAGRSYPPSAVLLSNYSNCFWLTLKKCVLGGRGLGNWGKGACQDQLGVIVQVAATTAPRLVTAAVPRELRVDPS